MSTTLPLMKRSQLPAGEVLCKYCTARCCRYFALPIDTPTEWTDFDYIRWYLIHAKTAIFVDDGSWYLMVYGDCHHLQPDNRCGIYETRPQICRDYTTETCEYDNDECYEQFFETAEQVHEYAEAILPPRQVKKDKTKKKKDNTTKNLIELPILASWEVSTPSS
ncbi:MAG: YkgJ family cysteine cluster protein [Planctomycetota bacterium]|nr:YkgJ family cysteine cluster protein [Planctomycetota bacterium]MDA1211645.1 YkgJ family cysteine cluster protein [Planctomycetota bacterium]